LGEAEGGSKVSNVHSLDHSVLGVNKEKVEKINSHEGLAVRGQQTRCAACQMGVSTRAREKEGLKGGCGVRMGKMEMQMLEVDRYRVPYHEERVCKPQD